MSENQVVYEIAAVEFQTLIIRKNNGTWRYQLTDVEKAEHAHAILILKHEQDQGVRLSARVAFDRRPGKTRELLVLAQILF